MCVCVRRMCARARDHIMHLLANRARVYPEREGGRSSNNCHVIFKLHYSRICGNCSISATETASMLASFQVKITIYSLAYRCSIFIQNLNTLCLLDSF